jgi:hypothetical protein
MSSQFLFWMARQHWPLQRLPVDHQLILIIKDMRNSLSEMLAILISTLTQDVAEQYAAPGRIHNTRRDAGPRRPESLLSVGCSSVAIFRLHRCFSKRSRGEISVPANIDKVDPAIKEIMIGAGEGNRTLVFSLEVDAFRNALNTDSDILQACG